MSGTPSAEPNRNGPTRTKSRARRIGVFAIGFLISLIVGRFFEEVASKEALAAAHRVQVGWIAALSEFSPFAVADMFGDKLAEDQMSRAGGLVLNDEGRFERKAPSGTMQDGIAAPMKALFATVASLVTAGGIVGLMQIGMGIAAIWIILDILAKRKIFEVTHGILFFVAWPPAVILAASLIAFALKSLMLGALAGLSWITGLAAGAAGATGVIGFCWYCLQKLGEKGAEHALTPKI